MRTGNWWPSSFRVRVDWDRREVSCREIEAIHSAIARMTGAIVTTRQDFLFYPGIISLDACQTGFMSYVSSWRASGARILPVVLFTMMMRILSTR
jgi:hypothetical protein